jgi:hypothetical protein
MHVQLDFNIIVLFLYATLGFFSKVDDLGVRSPQFNWENLQSKGN